MILTTVTETLITTAISLLTTLASAQATVTSQLTSDIHADNSGSIAANNDSTKWGQMIEEEEREETRGNLSNLSGETALKRFTDGPLHSPANLSNGFSVLGGGCTLDRVRFKMART